ncbi:flagellar hook-associated protein FlgK [Lentibacillus sp. CBA3610]|uniref:flagellar hook-associated protein FlgK n=1 Tax=Lentibacillus sp. CBA3610 TaxID=2518176 RepID=UPI00159526E7|nr:flagellar hook-associated protein FlgK [Lentibacillus sp. CBA3610]QKY69942.1 flagellar hook-associated protein FlgK [Lentibacillus sp. CBA3610]
MSTFHGLEMAKQALFAQQSALYTTGHNISNANTEGYTRQRVNFETASPFPPASRNRPEMAGQMGTGVETGTVQRIRNQFLDHQFRAENSASGYWETKADALSRMESLMNEPSETGLSETMDQFWQSLQDLSVNPEDSGARTVVGQRGQAAAETFNYFSDSLSTIRSDLRKQIDHKVDNANSILEQINDINGQVKNVETHGQLANDLYDKRDRLIDELSGIVNINVEHTESSDSASDIADGLVTIKLADDNGNALEDSVLVNGNLENGNLAFNDISVGYSEENYQAVTDITVNGEDIQVASFASTGALKGLIESYGYAGEDGETQGDYPEMRDNLDTMAAAFADAFNRIHTDGEHLKGEQEAEPFFQIEPGQSAAAGITVNEAILNDPDLIAASNGSGAGDGGNASDLADVFDEPLDTLDNTSVNGFYESIIGDMGVKAQEANRMTGNTGVLKSQVEQQRMSVSSVSLDEEMSNMIKFQHAYNAAARSMTAVDEMVDRVINNMGLVGR